MKIKAMVKSVYDDVTLHWSKPAKNNYVPYRELMNLGLGGMGQQFVILLLNYIGLAASNTLLGSTIGISPVHLQLMATVQTVFAVMFTFIRGKIMDNTKTKIGRFRPYIAIMGIPLVVVATIFMFLPFHRMQYTDKLIAVFCFAIAISMLSPFFSSAYDNLVSTITPSVRERTKVYAVNTLLFSIAPTITNALVPLFAGMFEGNYTNINLYRYVVVPIAVVGVSLNFFTAFGCKERVIEAKTYVPKVKIIQGSLEIFKNKYWWILNIATVIGFAEGAFGILFSWIFIYGTQDMGMFSLANTVLGTAATIGMVIAPLVLRKLGNKKTLLIHNTLNILFILCMMSTYKVSMLFFFFYYINTVINSLCLVYNPELYAEVKDYQQFLSKKRLDNTFGIAGNIWFPITLCTGLIVPFIYESFGLSTNYNILYDPSVRNPLFYIICAISVGGAVLNLIPYLFFNLSQEKHKWIMNCIRFRSAVKDYADGTISQYQIVNIVDVMNEYHSLMGLENVSTLEYKIKVEEIKNDTQLDKNTKSSQIKNLKKTYRAEKKRIDEKKAAQIFTEEINKFESDKFLHDMEIVNNLIKIDMKDLRSLSEEEIIQIACKDKKHIKRITKMVKSLHKHTDYVDYQTLRDEISRIADLPQNTKEETKSKFKELRKADRNLNTHMKIYRAYYHYKTLAEEYENYQKYPEIAALYEDAADYIRIQSEKEAEIKRLEKESKEREIQELKEAKFNKLPIEKQEKILAKRQKKAQKKEGRKDE